MNDVTRILQAINRGDGHAAAELLPAVYDELRKLAAHRLASERPGQTLQATALVHEAYLKVAGGAGGDDDDDGSAGPGGDPRRWENRAHFFAAAAEAMRRILVDAARRKQALRHGGDQRRVEFDDALLSLASKAGDANDLLALDEALKTLEAEDPTKAQLVKLRFFAGRTIEEAATDLSISRATAARYWEYARAFLRQAMDASGDR